MNTDILIRDIEKFKKEAVKQKKVLLNGIGQIIQFNIVNTIEALDLVDEGTFKDGITYELEDEKVIIHDTVPYGIYLEFGTMAHGPKKAKALHWIDKETGKDVFAKWVRGIPAFAPFQKGLDLSESDINKFAIKWWKGLA